MKYTKILKGHEKDFKKYIGKEGCNSHEYQQALFDCQIKAVLNIGIGVCVLEHVKFYWKSEFLWSETAHSFITLASISKCKRKKIVLYMHMCFD